MRYTGSGMRVLGIDCGSEATGYAILESDGRTHRSVVCGTLRLARGHRGATFAERLHIIHAHLDALIVTHCPDCVAIEDVFYARNVRSALKLAHVRGVAMQAAAAHELPVAEYTPLAVKSAVTGYGRAEKAQVQQMVRVLLSSASSSIQPDSFDASDAAAVAICHIHTSGIGSHRYAGVAPLVLRAKPAREGREIPPGGPPAERK